MARNSIGLTSLWQSATNLLRRPPTLAAPAASVPPALPGVAPRVTDLSMSDLVLHWLDAVLNLYLQRSVGLGNDLAGLSLSRGTIEQLLAQPPTLAVNPGSQANEAALQLAQSTLDNANSALLAALQQAIPGEEAIADVCQGLELSMLDTQTFLLCLAPELDNKYQRIYGFMHDDLSRRYASLGLIAAILGPALPVRMALAQTSRLFHWRILGHHKLPYADDMLRIDAPLVAWLLGNRTELAKLPQPDAAIQNHAWPGANWLQEASYQAKAAQLAQALGQEPARSQWLVLHGNDNACWRALLEQVSDAQQLPLLRINLHVFDGSEADAVEERLARLSAIARISGTMPVIDASQGVVHGVHGAHGAQGIAQNSTLNRLVSCFADMPGRCVLILPDLAPVLESLPLAQCQFLQHERHGASLTLYRSACLEAGFDLNEADLESLAAATDLPIDGLDRALRLARTEADAKAKAKANIGAADGGVDGAAMPIPDSADSADSADSPDSATQQDQIIAACRQIACPELPRFATLLEPKFTLQQVVLPKDQQRQLKDIVAQVVHSSTVLNEWGFAAQLPYGRGVAALFSGPSGTGKTMAACAIGHALQRLVFAVDLSRVISKYIGETEKNLNVVFEEAERAGAILLFDEADALFGKRSEVKDAHDRYANIETAYLLQRMEAFNGLAILTSNFGQNLDRAFLRRLRFVVEFPLPDPAAREQIWRQCFPPQAPLDEELDFHFLAHRVEMTGGHIRQVTLRAAFAAAAQATHTGGKISMHHILQATRLEATKLGMPGLERELAQLVA